MHELLRRDHDSARANLRVIVEEGGTCEQMKARAIAYYRRYFHDHDCFQLWVEGKLLACRDTWFQECFKAFRHEELDQLSAYIRTFSERNGRSLLLQSDAFPLGLVSLRDGVKFFGMCDPQIVSNEVMQTVLAGFFSCVLWPKSEEMPCADDRVGMPDRGCGRLTLTEGAGVYP